MADQKQTEQTFDQQQQQTDTYAEPRSQAADDYAFAGLTQGMPTPLPGPDWAAEYWRAMQGIVTTGQQLAGLQAVYGMQQQIVSQLAHRVDSTFARREQQIVGRTVEQVLGQIRRDPSLIGR